MNDMIFFTKDIGCSRPPLWHNKHLILTNRNFGGFWPGHIGFLLTILWKNGPRGGEEMTKVWYHKSEKVITLFVFILSIIDILTLWLGFRVPRHVHSIRWYFLPRWNLHAFSWFSLQLSEGVRSALALCGIWYRFV